MVLDEMPTFDILREENWLQTKIDAKKIDFNGSDFFGVLKPYSSPFGDGTDEEFPD